MKIRKLWISEYKNVKDIELDFQTDLTTLLVGQNGLGKSNLLEAISLIFNGLRRFTSRGDAFLFSQQYFDYKITYTLTDKTFSVSVINGEFLFQEINNKIHTDVTFRKFVVGIEDYLPRYILGYYSGENKRLRELTRDHEDVYITSLKKAQGANDDKLRPFFFAENKHSQLLLITLLLYKDHPIYESYIENLFDNYLNIEKVNSFDIVFKAPDWNYKDIGGINKSAENLMANIADGVDFPFWNLKGQIDLLLTRFYNHLQDLGREPIFADEVLEFRDINVDFFIKELYEYFESPIKFFKALEATMVVGVFDKCTIKLKKNDLDIAIPFEELSEGEQQLLTVLSLALFFGDKDCLMLLDEPDTHLNPNWQRDYIQLLNEFNLDDRNSHIFVATHSPLLVQCVQDDEKHKFDIILYCKDEGGNIEIENQPDIIKNWRIDQVLASKYFHIKSTRPKTLDEFMDKRATILKKGKLDEKDIASLKELENEFGYLPTGETISELKSIAYINGIEKIV